MLLLGNERSVAVDSVWCRDSLRFVSVSVVHGDECSVAPLLIQFGQGWPFFDPKGWFTLKGGLPQGVVVLGDECSVTQLLVQFGPGWSFFTNVHFFRHRKK